MELIDNFFVRHETQSMVEHQIFEILLKFLLFTLCTLCQRPVCNDLVDGKPLTFTGCNY